MDFGNSPRAQLTESFMKKFSDFFPDECIVDLETEQYNKVYQAVYDLIGYINLKHFLIAKKEESEDQAKIYGCKMTKEDVINKFSKTLDEYYQIEVGSPMNDNLTEILRTAIDEANRAETLVMQKIAGIVWEQRYSKTLDNDKFGRWMRIGRVNGMTVAIITKAEVENKPIRYVVRLPNNTGNESLQNDIITLSENEAMLEAEKYIAKYVSNFSA